MLDAGNGAIFGRAFVFLRRLYAEFLCTFEPVCAQICESCLEKHVHLLEFHFTTSIWSNVVMLVVLHIGWTRVLWQGTVAFPLTFPQILDAWRAFVAHSHAVKTRILWPMGPGLGVDCSVNSVWCLSKHLVSGALVVQLQNLLRPWELLADACCLACQ